MVIPKRFFLLPYLLCCQFGAVTQSDWTPLIYNAIKWTAPDQGSLTISYTRAHGITRIPMAYHGGVDTNASGDISERNIEKFTNWVHEFLPQNYCGPVVMDYEQPWWKEFRAKTLLPERLQEILSVYIQGVQVAKNVEPSAQWGYWGLPALRHTSAKWREQGLSIEPLIENCKALYPDVYNCTPGHDDTARVQEHISVVLEQAGGRIPVYVFASVRYCGPEVDHSDFVEDNIFLKQVNAALRASWTDESGTQHRVKGIILWDAYGFSPEEEWKELDQKHEYYFELLQALVDAWGKAMVGKEVVVDASQSEGCQYGLPEPANSSDAIYDLKDRRGGNKEDRVHGEPILGVEEENDRVDDGRIRGNRITE